MEKKYIKMILAYALVATLAAGIGIFMGAFYYGKAKTLKQTSQSDNGSGSKKSVQSQAEADSPGENGSESKNEMDDDSVRALVKDYMQNGKGTMALLRELFPEDVVVYNSNKFTFVPVDDSLAKNDIVNDNIVKKDNGEIEYTDGDNTISHKGIDVSKFQGTIDWKKVADSGVEFAIIRLGYRGYGTGVIVLDENVIANIEGATANGIKVGVYFFSQAITTAEAEEEADFVLENIKKYNITYPIVFDTEDILNENARTDELSVSERTDIAIHFCEKIKKAGYTPAIYANLRWFTMSLDMSKLEEYDKWYAFYEEKLYFPYKISMWQYSETGQVDGITGSVDLNISFKDWEKK